MKQKKSSKCVMLTFENEILAKLDNEAKKRGIGKSAFLSTLLYDFLNNNNKGDK